MSLIYNLKGALSINDIKASLEEIIDNPEEERHSLRDLYTCFLENCINDESNFKEDVINKIKKIDDKIEKNKLLNDEFEKRFLLLCSLVNMSNMYRRMSEKLIDEFFSKQE